MSFRLAGCTEETLKDCCRGSPPTCDHRLIGEDGRARTEQRIALLGPPCVQLASGEVIERLGGPRQVTVLCELALRCGEAVPISRLIDSVWGAGPPSTAANALQVYVSALRKILGRTTVRLASAAYVLDLDPDLVDVHLFRRLGVASHEQLLAGNARGARQLADEALALWRGVPFGDGTGSPSLEQVAGELEDQRLGVLETRYEAAVVVGEVDEAMPGLVAAVRAAPYRERLRELLARALYQAGRQAEALRSLAEARRVLLDDLGLDPGPRLAELERMILRQDPSLEPRSAGPEPTRLVVSELPRPARVVGRDAEITQLLELVGAGPGARLVTVSGMGGIGKTTLACEVVGRAAEHFQTVLMVDTRQVGAPADLVSHLAELVGLTGPDMTDVSALTRHLQSAGSALVLLDGMEGLPAAAPVIADLLTADRVRVCVTARRPLALPGEVVFPVGPLSVNGADSPALTLFWAGAGRGQGTGPGGRDDELALSLCRLLDGIPLAIELAASRTRSLGLEELTARLGPGGNVTTLGAGRDDAASLNSVLEYSWHDCDDAQRRILEAMSGLPASVDLIAVETICARWSARTGPTTDQLDPLAELVDLSLVQVSRAADGCARYRLLEPVRRFVADRLAPEETEALRDICARFFVSRHEPGPGLRFGWRTHAELTSLVADKPHLSAALTYAEGVDDELFARTVLLLASIEDAPLTDSAQLVRSALAHLPFDHPLRLPLLGRLVVEQGRLWDLDAALETAHEAVQSAERGTSELERCWSRVGLCLARADLQRPDDTDRLALANRIEAVCASMMHAPVGGGRLLGNLGVSALMREDFDVARVLFERGRAAAARERDRYSVASNTLNLASVALETGEPALCAELSRQVFDDLDPMSPATFIEARYFACAGSYLAGTLAAALLPEMAEACAVIGRYGDPGTSTAMTLLAAMVLADLGDHRAAAELRAVVSHADSAAHPQLGELDRRLRRMCDEKLPKTAATRAAASAGALLSPGEGCLRGAERLAVLHREARMSPASR